MSAICFVVTEEKQVFAYFMPTNTVTNLNEYCSILNQIELKEIKFPYLIDKDKKIYILEDENIVDINSMGLCDGKQIIKVNGDTYLDEDNGIWLTIIDNNGEININKESDDLRGKTIVKQYGYNDVVMIIDSDGYLYKYGFFSWLE